MDAYIGNDSLNFTTGLKTYQIMLKETDFCYKKDAVISCDSQCRECEITDRYEGIIRNITEELNDWKGQACAAVQSNLKSLSGEIMKVEKERDAYKNILIEIEAWLSFNTHPSKEQIAAFKDDLRTKIAFPAEIRPFPKEQHITIRIPTEQEINEAADMDVKMTLPTRMAGDYGDVAEVHFVNGALWMRDEITQKRKPIKDVRRP